MPLTVNAGADQAIPLYAVAPIAAQISGGTGTVRKFWRKISGPGAARFNHDLFVAGHEEGTFEAEWLAPVDGSVKGASEGGIRLTQEKAYSGKWSCKCENDPSLPGSGAYSAKVTRWHTFDLCSSAGQAAYYSAWYWWPPEYDVPSGPEPALIFQWKERNDPWDPIFPVFGKHHVASGNDIINIYDWQDLVAHDNAAAVIPKGQWFHIVAYLLAHDSAGVIVLWLNGVKMYHLTGENTLGNIVTNPNPRALMWGIANYANNAATRANPIWVDDCTVVADTADQLNTGVRFTEPGVYVLRLTATDDAETVSDDITITVSGEASGLSDPRPGEPQRRSFRHWRGARYATYSPAPRSTPRGQPKRDWERG